MENLNTELNYTTFIKYLRAYIKRDGIEQLVEYLDNSDAKAAPASTKYHLCVEGGLIKHSLNVFNRLIALCKQEYGESNCPYSKETIAIVSLLHDISKVNFYKLTSKRERDAKTGVWFDSQGYTVKTDVFRYLQHEEDSLHKISEFLKLSDDEYCAIRWHSGCFSDSYKTQSLTMASYKNCPLALLLHTADMLATCIDEKDSNKTSDENP